MGVGAALDIPGYRLEGLLGRGGMGVVYRAVHDASGRTVALKLLNSGSTALKRRFEREGRALRTLSHPNVCRAFDFGEVPAGGLYLAMELLEGEDLAQRLDRTGPLPVPEALRVAQEAAAGLACAHAAGLVHRDVKPSNLFLSADRVRVLDFGVSGWASEEISQRLTRTGDLIGTPAYMAPELARGVRSASAAADVYGLGATLYHLLSGDPPYQGHGVAEVVFRVLSKPPPPLRRLRPDVPAALAAAVERMMARNPDDRPVNMRMVAASLQAVAEGGPPTDTWVPDDPPDPGSLDGERRLVTVLVASGITDVAAVQEAVVCFGGETVAAGSRQVVGLFGARKAEGGEAARAVRAAQSCAAWCDTVAVGTGRTQGAHVAATVQRTAALAGRGVVLDDATAARVQDRFQIEDGRVVEALHAVMKSPPLLGRSAELADLRGQFERVRDDREAGGVLLVGPPGVGRTRLVEAFVEQMDAPTRLRAYGSAARRYTSWHTIAGALRGWAASGFDAAMAPLGLTASARGFLAHLAEGRTLLGPREPARMRDGIVSALGDWLDALLARGPVILAVEDLHHADEPSLRVVEVVLRRAECAPLFVIASARTGALTERESVLDLPELAHRQVRGLSRRAARELVQIQAARHGAVLDHAQRDSIVEHGGGNPYLLLELVRSHAEGATSLPVTVEAAIQARLDLLPDEDKDLLKRASVFGDRFDPGSLPALGCRRPEPALRRLLRSELLRRADPEVVYRQGAVPEVAYGLLTAPQRRRLHLAAGRWLARLGGGPAETVAAHLAQGGDLAGAAPHWVRAAEAAAGEGDLAAVPDRLERALAGAPEREDLRLWRLRALADCGRASAMASGVSGVDRRGLTPHQRAQLDHWRGTAAWWGGGEGSPAEAERWLDAAIQQFETAGDREWLARAFKSKAMLLLRGDPPRARQVAASGVQRVGDEGPPAVLMLDALALVLMHCGSLTEALAVVRRGLRASEATADLSGQAGMLDHLGYLLTQLGCLDEASRALEDALASGRRIGRLHVEGYALQNLGLLSALQGDFGAAWRRLDDAAELAARIDDGSLRLFCWIYRGLAAAWSGDARAAQQWLDTESPPGGHHAEVSTVRGMILHEVGDHRAAEAAVDLALEQRRAGMVELEAELLWLRFALTGELSAGHEARAFLENRVRELGLSGDALRRFIQARPAYRGIWAR